MAATVSILEEENVSLGELNDSLKERLEAAIVATEESKRSELSLKRTIVSIERKLAASQKKRGKEM